MRLKLRTAVCSCVLVSIGCRPANEIAVYYNHFDVSIDFQADGREEVWMEELWGWDAAYGMVPVFDPVQCFPSGRTLQIVGLTSSAGPITGTPTHELLFSVLEDGGWTSAWGARDGGLYSVAARRQCMDGVNADGDSVLDLLCYPRLSERRGAVVELGLRHPDVEEIGWHEIDASPIFPERGDVPSGSLLGQVPITESTTGLAFKQQLQTLGVGVIEVDRSGRVVATWTLDPPAVPPADWLYLDYRFPDHVAFTSGSPDDALPGEDVAEHPLTLCRVDDWRVGASVCQTIDLNRLVGVARFVRLESSPGVPALLLPSALGPPRHWLYAAGTLQELELPWRAAVADLDGDGYDEFVVEVDYDPDAHEYVHRLTAFRFVDGELVEMLPEGGRGNPPPSLSDQLCGGMSP